MAAWEIGYYKDITEYGRWRICRFTVEIVKKTIKIHTKNMLNRCTFSLQYGKIFLFRENLGFERSLNE